MSRGRRVSRRQPHLLLRRSRPIRPGRCPPATSVATGPSGALVQLPLLTGGRQRADEAIARADTARLKARLQQAREQAVVDTRTAYEELKAAQASWLASAGTVQQAERAYQIAELRYKEGVSTQLELTDAQVLLIQAQATRAQAARDLQVSRARVALLPDLPLGTTFSATSPTAPAGQTATPARRRRPRRRPPRPAAQSARAARPNRDDDAGGPDRPTRPR